MQEKPTKELEKMLSGMRTGELKDYYKENSKYMAEGRAFYYYMKDVVEARNRKLMDVYIAACVKESYGGQILRMEKKTKNRDLIIKLCLGGHFNVAETSKALKLYGMNPLYAKDKRDACIMVAINNRKYELSELDEILEQQGLDKLSNDE